MYDDKDMFAVMVIPGNLLYICSPAPPQLHTDVEGCVCVCVCVCVCGV